jgi:hypothetical protein
MGELVSTISAMAKRTFIQVACSQEYKDEYKRLLEAKYGVADADRLMSMDIRALLEQVYPSLRSKVQRGRLQQGLDDAANDTVADAAEQ